MKIKDKLYKIWAIAFPVVIQGIVFQLQSLTDKAFLGNLESEYISALGAAQFPYNTTMDTVVALGTGLVIYTALLTGAKRGNELKNYVVSSMFYGSMISIGLFLLWFFFAEPVLLLLNVDAQILPLSAQYIKICSASLILLGIDSALQAMLQGIGNTKPIMYCGILKVILNIVISYLLIFGVAGIPPMNIAGAAIGTLLANVISALLLVCYCLVQKGKEYNLLSDVETGLKLKFYQEVVKLGLPTAMEYFMWNASNLVLIAFLNGLSYRATAVYTLTFGIEVVIYAVFNGTGKAAMTLIGQRLGAKDLKTADSYLRICVVMNAVLVVLTFFIFLIFGKEILGIFTKDQDLIEMTGIYLVYTAVIMMPKSINVIIGNGIRAHGDTKWMLCTQIFGSILVVSCSYCLVKIFQLGIPAIYITLFTDELARSIINAVYYGKKYRPRQVKAVANSGI